MSSDRVGYVPDIDCVEVLIVTEMFYEYLIIQIILVFGHKYMNIPHDFQNIQTLKQDDSELIFETLKLLYHINNRKYP